MIPFPPKLPSPRINFEQAYQPNIVQNQMDTGATRQRGASSQSRKLVSVVWTFTNFEHAIFQAFVSKKLFGGSVNFVLKLPQEGYKDLVEHPAVLDRGEFKSSALAGNLLWEVSASLICDNPPQNDESFYDLFSVATEQELALLIPEFLDAYTIMNEFPLN